MYDGPITDAHHHLWEVRNYPWLNAPPSPKIFGEAYEPLRHDYLIDDLWDDFGANNVVKSVHVQAHFSPPDHIGETRWLQSVADVHGYPHGIVGYAAMDDAGVGALLDEHMKSANFRGIRDVVAWHPGNAAWQMVDQPEHCLSLPFRNGLEELEVRGLHFELQGFANQFDCFATLVGGHPGLNFCLVHAGLLTGDDLSTFDGWHRALEPLVDLKNLWIKCSGANNVNWGTPRAANVIARQYNALIDLFGADRCFFGSNFPVEKLKSTYDDLIAVCTEALAHRPEAEQKYFFHDTASAFYRLGG